MMLLVALVIAIVAARTWIARNSVWLALTLFSLYVIALRLKSDQRPAVSASRPPSTL